MPFSLAPALPAHRPAMAELWVESWARTLPEIDFVARRPWLEGHLDQLAAGGALTRVALAPEGTVAGFVVIHPGTGYLDQLAVAPRFWGQGAAEALMAEARRLSPALVALDVNQDNPRAVRFYEKMGLAVVSEGENPMSGRRTFRMEWRP
ncbi:GNAT family N-acetyltransferase [Xanthobacter dioxanivorans]|uniref:GNAT family N-acetyltransferase n=1 Tax=Xanthobacter dioxanivorans TaxID=2528964 RepID=A0A974PK61_9HYPH|nr:GNAT family N-acetyltransferase [Xanthobacter dioxanivorans]QRG04535.1 GNAT family N-acetyltransferase [Xanthobacter dioxanivorans]